MMRSVSLKVAAVAAILALGSVGLAHDALARGGGGGGGGGGGLGGGHFGGGHFAGGGHFNGGHLDHGGRFAGNFHDHGRRFFGGPFFGDYGYYGSDCWTTERIGSRWRRVWVCD